MKLSPHEIFVELILTRKWKNAYLASLALRLKNEGEIEWYFTEFKNEREFYKEYKKRHGN